MSGGSMDYLSCKVEEANFYETTPERKAFKKHLKKVAEALHRIEWNDSGDGADNEAGSIRACLDKTAVLSVAIEQAKEAAKELNAELERVGHNDYISGACRADVENKRRLLRIRWMFLLSDLFIFNFREAYE